MMFDPWQYIHSGPDEVPADITGQQWLQIAHAAHLERHRPQTGFQILEAVETCARLAVPIPDWLASELTERLQVVTTFKARSLDDIPAFGPPPLSAKEQLRTARIRQQWGETVRVFFSGKLPRTDVGYKKFAKAIGISVKQVRALVPKTRVNRVGPATSLPTDAAKANNPFSLPVRKSPKR